MKKVISVLLILMLVLVSVGCSQKEPVKTEEELKAEIIAEMEAEEKLRKELKAEIKAEMEQEQSSSAITYTDDEIITTYAYLNNNSVDVSSLKKIELNLIDEVDAIVNSDYQEYKKEMTWKIAFFGTVKNVTIYQSEHYSVGGIKLHEYDVLTDTELIITSREMGDGDAVFFVNFEDERGSVNEFTSWIEGREAQKVELHSGFTKEEKTPTSYKDFDISPYLSYIGMKEKGFLGSEMGQKCTKETFMGSEDYDYIIKIAKGIVLKYHLDKEEVGDYEYRVKENADIMSISISLESNDEGGFIDYETVPESERISMFGVDFGMTGVRAKKHFNDTLEDYDVSINAYVSSDSNDFNSIVIFPK